MRDPERILIVEGSGRGFLSHYAYALALGLHQRGHRVRLVTGQRDELAEWPAPFERETSLRSGLAGWITLMAQVRAFKPQVVHFQWLSDPVSAALFVRWAQRRGTAVVYTPHNLLPHRGRWMTMPLFRRLYRVFDRIVVRDTNMRWAASEILDVDPDRMSMALGSPNIIAHPQAPRRLPVEAEPRQPGEIRALHFGHGNQRKGLEPLLRALACADRAPQLHLMLAGAKVTGAIDPEVIAAARTKLRVSVIDRYLAPDEIGGLFEAADCIVMPYSKLCRSPILDLAAAFRKPVLRTNRVEATVFEDGYHGWTTDGGDFAAFAVELVRLTVDPARLHATRLGLESEPDAEAGMAGLAALHGEIYLRAVTDRLHEQCLKLPDPKPLIAGE